MAFQQIFCTAWTRTMSTLKHNISLIVHTNVTFIVGLWEWWCFSLLCIATVYKNNHKITLINDNFSMKPKCYCWLKSSWREICNNVTFFWCMYRSCFLYSSSQRIPLSWRLINEVETWNKVNPGFGGFLRDYTKLQQFIHLSGLKELLWNSSGTAKVHGNVMDRWSPIPPPSAQELYVEMLLF